MNTLPQVMSTMAAVFTAGMTASLPTVDHGFANDINSDAPRDPKDEWVIWDFRPVTRRPAALGRFLWRLYGLVNHRIFTPLGGGIGRGKVIADTIEKFYSRATLAGGIWVRDASFQPIGAHDGAWEDQLRISFSADES